MGFGKVTKKPKDIKKVDKKFTPYSREQLMFKDASVKNHNFFVIKFKTSEDDPYNRGEIRTFVQKKSDDLAKISPESVVSVTLQFENNNFKGGRRTKAGESVNLWDETDSGDYDQGDILGFHIVLSIPNGLTV